MEYSGSINQPSLGSRERRQRVPPSFSLCTVLQVVVVVVMARRGGVKALDAPRELSPGVLSACTVSDRAEKLYGYAGVSVQLLQTFTIRASMRAAHSAIHTLLPERREMVPNKALVCLTALTRRRGEQTHRLNGLSIYCG